MKPRGLFNLLLAWPLVFDGVLGETSPKANDIKNCFKMDDKFAGSRTGYYVDDMTLLSKIVRADTRMGGFQVCTDTETGNISSFRIKNANKYGNGNTISMSKLGTGSTTCGNYMLRDPVNEIVTNLVLFFNRSKDKVQGLRVATAGKVANFGQTDLTDFVNFSFTKDKPLIGLTGFSG